jgi:hypothetical protein
MNTSDPTVPVTKPSTLISKMTKELIGFRKMLPIVRAFCHAGLQERHINSFVSIIKAGDDAKDIGKGKLNHFRSLSIQNFKNELEEISETTSKEFSNDNSLKKM